MQANSRRAFGMVAQTSQQDARTARTEAAVTFDTLYLSALRESLELVAIKNYAKNLRLPDLWPRLQKDWDESLIQQRFQGGCRRC